MRRFGRLLLVTLLRGVLLLAPVVLLAVLVREGWRMLRELIHPIAQLLPAERFFGILTEDLISAVVLVLAALLAGLFVATRPGRSLSDRLERTVLYRVPGYLILRGAVAGVPGLDEKSRTEPALVNLDDGWAFALVVERLPSGFCTIFLPDSPTPTTGDVRIIEASRVRPLDAPMLGFLGCLTRSGVGAGDLVGRVLIDREAGPGRDQSGPSGLR
ncbi:hypothetical protein [Planctomyces sp. SH-PL62]|uniref:hypothetical protein n=1 Tax=Planctomyces sp. SH-PL62 TaxID=1636152 RepID=UPI00078B2E84|nr:hypothetical protein [Planctomyces sp. SH-PL62]AMV36239.1 hypothetical protein VT85_02265 [Planctomyces sp. SH-PL62]